MKAAVYARFSTDKQSENSIDDQFRVCESLAERHGLTVVARYSDAAISGGTAARPGYQRLLAAARRHEFEIIIAEDASRLWRLLAEQAPRLAELTDLGVHVVTHDLDTRLESAGILGAVSGAMSEQYRKEIGRRTRRGLEGRARAGKSAGGRPYGYVPAALSGTRQIEIDEAQAVIVREIFEKYAHGWSPRAVAAELNRRGVPSPGSHWNRTTRRRSGWLTTAIAGEPKRGLGVLNNEIYVGRVIWNRTRWIRSATDSSRRRCVVNPQSEWIVRDEPRLRIVPQELWDRVKDRQRQISAVRGARIRAGLKSNSPGRGPKFMLSGLLKCGSCGANFVIADRAHYACGSRVGGRACDNDARIKRTLVESDLLAGVQEKLLAPEVIAEARQRLAKGLKGRKVAKPDTARMAKLQAEVGSLVEAIASGALRASPALAQRLAATEAELARLQDAARPRPAATQALAPRLVDRWRAKVENLVEVLASGDVARARTELRQAVGELQVVTTPEEIRLHTTEGAVESAFVRAAGGQQINVVAGAGFEPATFGL